MLLWGIIKLSNNLTKLICIIGIDGSGKTTLGKKLHSFLKKKKINAVYVYARLKPFFAKPVIFIGNFFFVKDYNMKKDYINYKKRKNQLFNKNSLLSRVYILILLLDNFIQLLIKIRIPLKQGKIVVCDRYIQDTIVTDLAVDMQLSIKQIIFLLDKSLNFLPKPALTLLVDVPVKVAYSRKTDVPDISYLHDRRNLYLDIAKKYNYTVLDGNKEIEDVFSDARERLNYVLNL